MDDFRKILYGVVIGFLGVIVSWISIVTISSCGYSLSNCNAAAQRVERTAIPTLIPATLPLATHPATPTPTIILLANLIPTKAQAASTGMPTATLELAATPTSSAAQGGTEPETTEEPAHPSNPGGPGPALNLTGDAASGAKIFSANCAICHNTNGTGGIENAGSSDGTVPALNPIDPTIANADPKVFAYNIDLFVEHGSTPETPPGSTPERSMPPWGDLGKLTPQQIADVIAYLISLNK